MILLISSNIRDIDMRKRMLEDVYDLPHKLVTPVPDQFHPTCSTPFDVQKITSKFDRTEFANDDQ
jgi:hypothetical protein